MYMIPEVERLGHIALHMWGPRSYCMPCSLIQAVAPELILNLVCQTQKKKEMP